MFDAAGVEEEDTAPLGYLLRYAAGLHRLQVDRALSNLDVTAPQFLILTLLTHESGLSAADLARRTGLSMPTVSAIVQRLKAAGSVESRAHPEHGRIRNLYLTPQGRDRHRACDERVEVIECHLAAAATPAGIAMVRHWLRQVGR